MSVIHKINLKLVDNQIKTLPLGFKILSCQIQHGDIALWYMWDGETNKKQKVHIVIVGTGNECDLDGYTYISTFQQGVFVWHVFYKSCQ